MASKTKNTYIPETVTEMIETPMANLVFD